MTDSHYSKTKTSFYRRLLVAHLIATGTHTVPAIGTATGMPRRTIQDTINALAELDIDCEFIGATKDGHYQITHWGPIDRDWVSSHIAHIQYVLGYSIND